MCIVPPICRQGFFYSLNVPVKRRTLSVSALNRGLDLAYLRSAASGGLDSDNFIETVDDMRKLLWYRATELCADALDGKRANLADLDPRTLG